jgi:hypothetical protein
VSRNLIAEVFDLANLSGFINPSPQNIVLLSEMILTGLSRFREQAAALMRTIALWSAAVVKRAARLGSNL